MDDKLLKLVEQYFENPSLVKEGEEIEVAERVTVTKNNGDIEVWTSETTLLQGEFSDGTPFSVEEFQRRAGLESNDEDEDEI